MYKEPIKMSMMKELIIVTSFTFNLYINNLELNLFEYN